MKLLKFLKYINPLRPIIEAFRELGDHDAHGIVSAKGWEILNDPVKLAKVQKQIDEWKEKKKRGEPVGRCVVVIEDEIEVNDDEEITFW